MVGLPEVGLVHPLLDLAWRVARESGDVLLAGRAERLRVSTKTTRTDVVTQMDIESEGRIVAAISRERPDDGLLGEEGTSHPGTSGLRWVVDPLDGTVNYLYGQPGWAVSVAVEELDDDGTGRAVVGVVDAPVYGETFLAVRGQGSVLVERAAGEAPSVTRLVATGPDDLSQALVATGFGYAADRRAAQARTLAMVLPRVRDIRRAGAAAIDLCWTALGRSDCYYERGLNPWDHAAGVLVAEEAGLVAGGPAGGRPDTELTWLAPPGLAEPWAQLLAAAGADRD